MNRKWTEAGAIFPCVIMHALQDNASTILFTLHSARWSRFCTRAYCSYGTRPGACNQCIFVNTRAHARVFHTPSRRHQCAVWKFYLEFFFVPPTWIGFPRGLITRATQPFSSFRSGIQAGPREEAEPLPSATVNYNLTFDLTKRSRMRTVISEDQATSTVFYRLKEAEKNNCNCKFSVARVSPRNPQIIFYIRTERVAFAENFTSTLIH